jgi:hypothetical protein
LSLETQRLQAGPAVQFFSSGDGQLLKAVLASAVLAPSSWSGNMRADTR